MLRGPAGNVTDRNSNMGATAFAPGAMTSSTTSNPWSPYFGEPMRELKLNPYSAYGRENWALPDAYQGSVPYMTQLMIHIIAEEDLWPTRVVAPIRITESEMEVAWDEIVFNDHMLAPVPEEGVSRLVTQQTNERRDHYVRYGIALILEHGFMKTSKGQQAYQMNILQIRNATLETMYFGVIEAILNSKQYSQAWTRKYGTMARSGSSLRGYLGDEVERYMVVQKTEHGFDLLDNKAKKYLRSNGVTPDTWVLPEGTSTFLQMVRPENRDYYIAGPDGPSGYKTALNDAPYKGVRQIAANSCAVYESKSFEVPGAPAPVDPLVRDVSVGEYVTLTDTVVDVVAPKEYRSFMRDIFVYDERRDDFSRVTLRNALKACCRFDDSGALWFPSGFRPKSSYDQDPFIKRDGGAVVAFGDIDPRYMPDEIVHKVAESIVSKFLASEYDKADKEADEVDYEKWYKSKGAPGDKKFTSFYSFVKQRLGSSRVFTTEYTPTWRKGGPEAGFFWNTIGKLTDDKRGNEGSIPDVDNTFLTINLANQAIPQGFADDKIKWDVVRAKLAEVLSSEKTATPSEAALTASTVDKFVTRIGLIGNNSKDDETNIFRVVASIVDGFLAFKAHAKDWLKNYQFVAHKALGEFAKVTKDSDFFAKINTALQALKNRTSDRDAQFKGTGAEVSRALFGDAAAQPENVSDDPEYTGRFPLAIGAFDIPALNAHFGAGDFDVAPLFKRARFGAVLSTNDGVSRGGPSARGFSGDGEVDLEAEAAKVKDHSYEFAARYAELRAADNYKTLIKSVMLTFLHTPVTEQSLLNLIEKDVYFPFEFILFRPRITHQMATGVLLKAGAETAETLVGHADFQLTDDVVRKMHYGHFTLYSKTIVWKSDNIYLAENIVATGYVGGNDVSFNTLDSLYVRTGEQTPRSFYAALVPVSTRTTEDTVSNGVGYYNPMDVTGRFAQNVPHLAGLDAEVGNPGGLHYPGAEFYANTWRMSNSGQQNASEFTPASVNAHNTLCFQVRALLTRPRAALTRRARAQGHQMGFNPSTKVWDLTTLNTGHFGERIYPGCGKVRSMKNSKYLQPVSYASAHGSNSHMTTLGV